MPRGPRMTATACSRLQPSVDSPLTARMMSPGQEAGVLGGGVAEGSDDDNGAVDHVDGGADAFEGAADVFAAETVAFGVDEDGVFVPERVEDAVDGGFAGVEGVEGGGFDEVAVENFDDLVKQRKARLASAGGDLRCFLLLLVGVLDDGRNDGGAAVTAAAQYSSAVVAGVNDAHDAESESEGGGDHDEDEQCDRPAAGRGIGIGIGNGGAGRLIAARRWFPAQF